jgi:hypothetical protein
LGFNEQPIDKQAKRQIRKFLSFKTVLLELIPKLKGSPVGGSVLVEIALKLAFQLTQKEKVKEGGKSYY